MSDTQNKYRFADMRTVQFVVSKLLLNRVNFTFEPISTHKFTLTVGEFRVRTKKQMQELLDKYAIKNKS